MPLPILPVVALIPSVLAEGVEAGIVELFLLNHIINHLSFLKNGCKNPRAGVIIVLLLDDYRATCPVVLTPPLVLVTPEGDFFVSMICKPAKLLQSEDNNDKLNAMEGGCVNVRN